MPPEEINFTEVALDNYRQLVRYLYTKGVPSAWMHLVVDGGGDAYADPQTNT